MIYLRRILQKICENFTRISLNGYMTERRPISVMNHQFQARFPCEPVMPERQWLFSYFNNLYVGSNDLYSTFSVMSYNILSPELLKEHMYLYKTSPNRSLSWECRNRSIIGEIRYHNVDILCLQELEEIDYNNIFKPHLSDYDSVYKKKTGFKTDGCAIFYKKQAFTLENYVAVEFNRSGNSLLNRDNIGQVALFQPSSVKNKNMKFCVSTTHLLFNPKRGDVKLAQLCLLLAEIDKVAFKGISSANIRKYHPVILCGDFNSVPFSPLYNFITSGSFCCKNKLLTGDVSGQREGRKKGPEMASKLIDLRSLGISQECRYIDLLSAHSFDVKNSERLIHPRAENMTSPNTKLLNSSALLNSESMGNDVVKKLNPVENMEEALFNHCFNFVSSYKHIAVDDSMEVTTCNSRTKCTVDYMFYSRCRNTGSQEDSLLLVLGVFSLFSRAEMKFIGKLPNWIFPSDHMCLITRFALCSS